jgi:hypothetical protein
MLRGSWLALVTSVLLALPATTASAQYGGYGGGYGGGYYGWGGWGATPVGDIARGMGAYAQGVGVYNVETAQARSINADTMMRWNSYMWASQNALNREHYTRMLAERERNKTMTDQILTRLRDNPTPADIERGDALNVILEQLSDPRIHSSALRMTRVPIKNTWIKEIPFHYASEAVTLSLHSMSSDDNWPTALRGDNFKAEREGFRKAIDAALEQDKEKDLTPETIQNVRKAIDRLRDKVETGIPKDSKDYIDAEHYLKALYGMAKMLENPVLDQVLASLEKYDGTTVADLLAFMQMFNLRFGSATTPRERGLYQNLWPLLDQQRDQIMNQMADKIKGAPPSSTAPTGIFHEMPWEHLVGRAGTPTPAPPAPDPKKNANPN